MGKISNALLESFRYQLQLARLVVIDEFEYDNSTLFVIQDDGLTYFEIESLMRICKFSVLALYYKGDKKMHLRIYHDE